jgi:hypothetical protein
MRTIPNTAIAVAWLSIWHGSFSARAQFWAEIALSPPSVVTPGAEFGASISTSEGWLLIGAPGNAHMGNGANQVIPSAGAAFLYKRGSEGLNTWGFICELVPDERYPFARFGEQVHFADGKAFVSAPGDRLEGISSGRVLVFSPTSADSMSWGATQRIEPNVLQQGLGFGNRFCVEGGRMLVHAPDFELANGTPVGALFAYEAGASGWFGFRRMVPGNAINLAGQSLRLIGRQALLQASAIVIAEPANELGKALQFDADSLFDVNLPLPIPRPVLLADSFGFASMLIDYRDAWASNNQLFLIRDRDEAAPSMSPPYPMAFAFEELSKGGLAQSGRMIPFYLLQDMIQDLSWWGWGESLVSSGSRAVVGAFGDANQTPLGHAEVFDQNLALPDQWVHRAYLTPSDPQTGDRFGWSVGVDGGAVFVGAPGDGITDFGKLYVFLEPAVGISATGHSHELLAVYPCPVSAAAGELVIVNPFSGSSLVEVKIISAQGVRPSFSVKHFGDRLRADVRSLQPGAYVVSLSCERVSRAVRFMVIP